jgi:anti-sigma B factor antagonist
VEQHPSDRAKFSRSGLVEGRRKLVIDLAGLDHVDSSGIGVLLACTGLIEERGGRMRISGAHGLVAKSFGIVHLDRIVGLDPDLESSCRDLSAGSAAV